MSEIITLDSIPDLKDFIPASADLSSEYWTPEDGEVRRLVFWGIEKHLAPKIDNPNETVELDCCVFIEPNSEGYSTVTNGSRRLVAAFENSDVAKGTPVQITYLGKKKNRTNSYNSDHWSVVTLKAKAK